MFCKKCGTQILEGGTFCPNCGEKVISETLENGNYTVTTGNNKKSNNKKMIIIIACVLVVLLILIATVGSIIASASQKAALEEKNERLKEICIEAVQRISLDEIAWEKGIYSDMSLQLGHAVYTIDNNASYYCELSENENPHIVTIELIYYTYEDDPDYFDRHIYTFLVETIEYEQEVLTYTTPYLEEVDSADFGYMSFDTYILEGIVDMYYYSMNSGW